MEPAIPPANLFELQIDTQSNVHLSQAAKWAKFLSIVGFICCGLVLIWGLVMGVIISSLPARSGAGAGLPFGDAAGIGGSFFLVFAIILCVVYFFPCLYLFRFGTKMQTALRDNDQNILTSSFGNLKSFYRFVGILTIIGIAVFLLEILFVMIFATRAVY